jgi:hypothetical protein
MRSLCVSQPERPDHLVLMMTVLPLAGPDAVFSDAIA